MHRVPNVKLEKKVFELANFNGGPILHFIPVYKNRITPRFVRKKPLILKVRGSPPEENRDRTGEHTVENRSPREAIPSGLQAEIGIEKRFEDRRRSVRAARPGAVHGSARAGRVAALAQQDGSEVVPERLPRRAGEAEERASLPLADEALPLGDVGGGSGVESGGVGHADVEVVPRVAFDQEAGDVLHPWLVDAARTPIFVFGAAEIPCDAAHGDEVIPAVGSFVVRLVVDPLQHHLAVLVAFRGGGIRPEVFPDGESGVEGDVERRGGFGVGGSTFVAEHPVVEDNLRDELGIAPGAPGVQIIAILEDFLVEGPRKVVHEDSPGATLVLVVDGGILVLLRGDDVVSGGYPLDDAGDVVFGGEGSGEALADMVGRNDDDGDLIREAYEISEFPDGKDGWWTDTCQCGLPAAKGNPEPTLDGPVWNGRVAVSLRWLWLHF
ncbi:hypothetical protein G2W53_034268 [Senna tora]|uniref:Uncharacterized protein n=1 Tax=Senna tora TaxID=362788 RepID=A0A834W8R5_9FABA|nr:hypothetical protein G2W53_034268 [Senna tora]